MRLGAALLLSALQACTPSPSAEPTRPAPTGEAPTPATAAACAAESVAALAAGDMDRLAAVVGTGQRLAFTPFALARASDVSLGADELAEARRQGHARDWGTLGESDDPLRLPFADYLARYGWDPLYAQLGPRPAGTAGFDAAGNEVGALLAAIVALHPGASITEYQRPPTSPGAMDWRVLRVVCVAHGSGWRLARLVHSEWTP